MYLSVDIDDAEIRGIIEDECENAVKLESKLMADAEITKQFESIQKELEGCILRHVDEKMAEIQTDIENRVEEDIYNLKESLNLKLNTTLTEHIDGVVNRTVRDQLNHLKIVHHGVYLESGEGTAGKERAAKEYNDTIPMEDL